MFHKNLAISVCDAECGHWEILVRIVNPATGQESPLWLNEDKADPSTSWFYSAVEKKWFCPRCAPEKRAAADAALAFQDQRQEEARGRMQGVSRNNSPFLTAPQMPQAATVAPYQPAFQQLPAPTYQPPPPPPPVYRPPPPQQQPAGQMVIPAGGNQLQSPMMVNAGTGGQQAPNVPQLARPPVFAAAPQPPQQRPQPAPAQYAPAPDGEMLPIEYQQAPQQAMQIAASPNSMVVSNNPQSQPGEIAPVPLDAMPIRFVVDGPPGRGGPIR